MRTRLFTMMSLVQLLLPLCLLSALLGGAHGDAEGDAERRLWGKSPLPVFTKVQIEHTNYNATVINVRYKTNERPNYQWFIDDVPFEGGVGDFVVDNHYDGFMLCMTRIYVPDSMGTRFSVCLQTRDAQNCLHLRPLIAPFDDQEEFIDVPWPLLVPAPLARYYRGRNVTIYAPEMDTWDYTYSGRFIYLQPGQVNQPQPLRQMEYSLTGGGQNGNVVTMRPVTSGSPGWFLRVKTSMGEYEGELLFQTTYQPSQQASAIVERCISTRPIHIYQRGHFTPFPGISVAMLPHSGDALSVTCRSQSNLFCLIACPFAFNGDVRDAGLSLSRVEDDGVTETRLELTSLSAEARQTGQHLAEARFVMSPSDDAQPGLFRCSVTLASQTASALVRLTIM
ncbi:uncharacterized protein LOC143284655 [Babylonia areolata]|uniref:uncharacterized protein LOC143284655 n=1 Tax=Babylonia areolata TaxID=304850 RepID=UPI003FD457B1